MADDGEGDSPPPYTDRENGDRKRSVCKLPFWVFFFFFPSCVFCSAWVLSSILFMVRVLMQPLPFRKVVVGFTVDSLQGVCILDVSCSRQHGCLGWGGGEVGVCRFKEWEFKAFFFFFLLGVLEGEDFEQPLWQWSERKLSKFVREVLLMKELT